ncbi:MAG TPA: hypothetical protein V6C81_13675 [Planktothrix sp.]|jgi:hypothetical protein
MLSKQLRTLTGEDLRKYAECALLTWGDLDDFRHFLPRVFELAAAFEFLPETPMLFSRLKRAKWRSWPMAEQIAVEQFLWSWWESSVSSFPGGPVEETLEVLAQAFDDLTPFLVHWRANDSPAALRHFGESWQHICGASWYGRDHDKQAREWLCTKPTQDWILNGYLRYENENWAEDFASSVDLMLSFATS